MTLHSYRSRWDEAEPDAASRWLDTAVKEQQRLSQPGLYIQGEVDGVNPPPAAKDVPAKFAGPFTFVTLPGVGHFPQREAPDAVADALSTLFLADPAPSETAA